VIFSQGEICTDFFVILRGSVKVTLVKEDYGLIPIVINTIYDGREFGETNHYEVSENLSSEMIQ
jgi:CRP-like cAMP-binding protein